MGEIRKKEEVYRTLLTLEKRNNKLNGVSAGEISRVLKADRANISRYLNDLCRDKRLKKTTGRPVLYSSIKNGENVDLNGKVAASFDNLVGAKNSLSKQIQQAKAAILYPPKGLHVLLLGGTGTGKSMFAELMHRFAIESRTLREDAPFVQFNCADYADNPQLVMAQIFGVKKGAYTGASRDREGLLKKADGGIFFLDEVHRLSPQGQELLFTFIDKGYFRPLGETEKRIRADVQIVAATTENPESYLLDTFIRRIPMTITLPSLKERGLVERYLLIHQFLKEESIRIGRGIYINKNALISFLLYNCPNNIGQLRSDLQLACARAFLTYKTGSKEHLLVSRSDLPEHVKKGMLKLPEHREDIEELLQGKGELLKFSYENEQEETLPEMKDNRFFYDIIEEKLSLLRRDNIDEEKITEILNIDIESYFKQHLKNLPVLTRKEEVRKVVDDEVADTAEEILSLAHRKLKRSFDERIYLGLALHLQKSIERIASGDRIYHPELNHIRASYAE
ncbi:MAG TPA: sigma 54-interacting transcriptional regulator, partial [Halanaerobiales bacterium]|nr:sigma 54-interacting transcriptional regulator [Halanaerobiales bacterium]